MNNICIDIGDGIEDKIKSSATENVWRNIVSQESNCYCCRIKIWRHIGNYLHIRIHIDIHLQINSSFHNLQTLPTILF